MGAFIDRATMPDEQMCQKCGRILPIGKLERMRTGTYRQVCNQCKWVHYVKPSRVRRILRDLEKRHKQHRKEVKDCETEV